MNGLVAVKRVVDYNVKVRLKADGSAVETAHVKMSMNPFDEIALEEAIRLKEAGKLDNIIAVSIGPLACQDILREALARSADRAILIHSELNHEPLHIAKILQCIVQQEKIELVFLGKQAIDDDCHQTGPMLAGFLGWSQGTNISKITWEPPSPHLEVSRETDSGIENLQLTLPSVLTADLRLNEPRYIALPNLMKAKTKPLTIIKLETLCEQFALNLKPHSQVIKVSAPVMKREGKKLNSVKELVEKLKSEAKVI